MDNLVSIPLVSVIIPVYNAERYLEQTVRSVQAQTFSNLEVLLVDDCSTDSSREIMCQLALNDSRIQVYFNEQNLGVAATRNFAIEKSRGAYLAFLDADDLWYPKKLEKQLSLQRQTEADIIYSSYSLINDECEPSGRSFVVRPRVDFDSMLFRNEIGCSTALVRKAALGMHRFSEIFYHEDYVLWMLLLRSGCAAAGVTDVLVDYRILPGSRSYRKFQSARMRWIIYRKALKLPLWKCICAFVSYAISGIMTYYS